MHGIEVKNSQAGRGRSSPLRLSSLASATGERWLDVRKTLKPRYRIVWRDICICYCSIFSGVFAVAAAESAARMPAVAAVAVPGAIWIGYWMHALFLFCHEGAHWNLAPSRRSNDRWGDWLVWLLFGSTTGNYRRTHMSHHVHLGDHEDTETTYHLCLSVTNMLKALAGLSVLEVLLRKARAARARSGRPAAPRPGTASTMLASARSAALHAAIVCGLWFGGSPVAAAAWVIAVACVFPLCATLRTIVEHRRSDASCAVDFGVEIHGAVNRLFGTGLCSRYFGSAGFNRHLLHHWDPAISYTRFDDMERFLLTTPLAAQVEACRTSYGTAIRTLMAVTRNG